MIELLFYPIVLFILFPPLALVPAGLFGWALWRRRAASWGIRAGILAAVLVWLLFGVYESFMLAWSKTVIAPIRVDLLLLAPVLYAVSILGAVLSWSGARRVSRSDTP